MAEEWEEWGLQEHWEDSPERPEEPAQIERRTRSFTASAPEAAPEAPLVRMGFEGKAAQAQVTLGDDLWEMHSAGTKVAEFTTGRTFADYQEHELLRAVAERMLALMAEASHRVAAQSPEIAARLQADSLHALDAAMTACQANDATVWRFVAEALLPLLANVKIELEAWHEG